MAKKKANLISEELLEQALATDEKKNELPSNWILIKLDRVINDIKNGTTIKQNKDAVGPKVTRIESIQNNKIDFGRIGYISEPSKIKDSDWYKIYDIALSHINSAEHVGKTALIDEEHLPLVHGMNLLRIRFNKACNARYFHYYSQSYQYKDSILQRINMAINQVSINQKQIADIEFPLPPLAEQQRIVERIESLFEKLDQAKELIQDVLNSFENRKAAILHKAFSGELTKKWREENGSGMESWEEKTLESVCKSIYDGDHMPPPKSENGVPFIVISNVNTGMLSFENTRFVPKSYFNKLTDTRKACEGDLLYTIVGSYGIPVLVNSKREFCFQRHIALLKPSDINNKFLWYVMQTSDIYEKVTNIATGTAQLTVPIKGLRKITIKMPTRAEQNELVKILDEIFEKEQNSKKLYNIVAKIDLMKKSILARAFRGELGTNDPTEERALSLLQEVISNR